MEREPSSRVYEFGGFRLEAQRRVLSSRIDGQPIQVTAKIFDTLLHFVERAGQVLHKQELMDALWPNVVVEESNLTQTIHTLRRLLGERAGEHKFIVTVPGRGYSFVADVKLRPAMEEPPASTAEPVAVARPPRRHRMVAAAFGVLAVAMGLAFALTRPENEPEMRASALPSVSLAVLPFVDMSEKQDQVYFADGLSEEILNLLAQSSGMRVIARTSSFSFKTRQDLDVEAIATKLDATHVLEGSVRKSGDRIRITAQLVDGATSGHLWSQTYDREATDIFAVQDEIAAAVAASLNATLGEGHEPQRADSTNPLVFERYLHGRFFFNRRGDSDLARAREYFQQALQIDPTYARAWAGLAGTYHAELEKVEGSAPEAQRKLWLDAVERGLSLGPGLAEVHVRAAQYYWWSGDLKTSEEHCKLAIALNPSDALVLTVSAFKAIAAGKWHEAVSLQRRAVAVDPLSAPGHEYLAQYLGAIGEARAAEEEFRHARELSPMLANIDLHIARALVVQRRFDDALALIEKAPPGPRRDQGLALVYQGMGRKHPADEALARLTATAEAPGASPILGVFVAEAHAHRGNDVLALKWVDTALHAAAGTGSTASVRWIKHEVLTSSLLRPLHEHKLVKSLMTRELLTAARTTN